MTIDKILDLGDDVLLVRATDENGKTIEARGWVSATTNHYDPDGYHGEGETVKRRDVSGHLRDDATPRTMTPAEVTEYAHRLLAEQHGTPATVESTPIAFE